MKTLSSTVVLFLTFVIPASAAPQVYPGCAVPAATPKNIWYIDPIHGSTSGNGSQAHPWNSLAAAVSDLGTGVSPLLSTIPYVHYDPSTKTYHSYPNPSAPIHPGDEILLMSGNYGNIGINSYNYEITNSDFVTIAAAPGQTPVLSTLYIAATNHWVFSGLKVQSLSTTANGNPLVYVKDQGASYPTSNLIFQNLIVSSQDVVSSWTQANWLANARDGLVALGTAGGLYTTCVSVTGSHMTNVKTGASLSSNNSLFVSNQIDHFGDDGLDYSASNLIIKNNYIHDNSDIGDGVHPDAMQGQIGSLTGTAGSLNYFTNIVIDSNTIIRQMDPHLQFPTYLSGIDAFDEDWTNLTVTNNVVITNACYGIAFSSIHNSMIANNTVLNDGLIPSSGNCLPIVQIGDKTHEGPSSSNSILRNNIAMSLSVYNIDPGVEMDHNICISTTGACLSDYEGGVATYFGTPGTYANSNKIVGGGTAAEFLEFSPATLSYAVLLKAGAPAVGVGLATGAPTVDILGDKRTTPYTAGAYAYPF